MALNIKQHIEKLKKPIHQQIVKLEAELHQLRNWLTALGGGAPVTSKATIGKKRGPKPKGRPTGLAIKVKSGKRERRNPEQLTKYADQVYQFVKTHPKCGGGDIRKQFPKVGLNIKEFVAKYSSGHKITTAGRMSGMKYSAA